MPTPNAPSTWSAASAAGLTSEIAMPPSTLGSCRPARPDVVATSLFLAVALFATAAATAQVPFTVQRITASPEVIAATNSVDDDLTCDGIGGNACVVFR